MPSIFHGARVLRDLITVDTVNSRDLKLAASLERDIVVDSPLTFNQVSVNQLYTDDLISSINFNNWTRDALQQNLDGRTQVVTAPWSIKTGHVDILSPQTTLNGLSVNNFMQMIDAENRAYQDALKRKCQVVQTQIVEAENDVVYLSNFEDGFKILVKNQIKSIYLFSVFKQNYLLINSGCETDTYIWIEPNQTYVKVNTVDTGIVKEWIHVLDLENNLFLISNDYGAVANSSCTNSGANIWRLNFIDQRISKEVQIGGRGDYRSLEIKPNSRAYFFAIRNIDNHGIELNLRGAIEAEWPIENREPPYARFDFGDGRLIGMTPSERKSFSSNSPCDCKGRDKRCIFNSSSIIDWESFKIEKRQQFEKTANQFRSNLENSRNVLRSILNPKEDPIPKDFVGSNENQTDANHEKLEQLKDLIRESKEKTIKLLEMASIHLNVSRNFEEPSTITTQSDSGNENTAESVQPNIDGPLLVSIMDAVDDAVKLNPNSQNASVSAPIVTENTSNICNENALNTSDPVLGSGEKIVNLMDLIEKIIEDNRQQHQEQAAYENNHSPDHYQLGKAINKSIFLNDLLSSSNSSIANDPQIGTLIGLFLIESTLPNKNENVSNSISGDDDKKWRNVDTLNEENKRSEGNHSSIDEINLKRVLDLIDQAENATNSPDVQVGDAFGDLFTKVEPFADKIMDDVIAEMRRRKYDQQRKDPQMVGAVLDADDDESANANMSNFKILFRKIGRSAIKMYTSSKDKVMEMKKFYHDAKYLYSTYYHENQVEDNKNDNKTYGPPYVYDMNYHGQTIRTDNNSRNEDVLGTKKPKNAEGPEDPEKSEDFEDIEDLNSDMKALRASNPNADEMSKAFVIEMVKRFAMEDNYSDKNGTRFWKIVRTGVTRTFNKHLEHINQGGGDDDKGFVIKESDLLIFEELMRNVNATIEYHKKSKTNDPAVGSTMNLDTNNDNNNNKREPILGDLFGDLFDKFTPLVDNLSDEVFDELRNRYPNNHGVNNYRPASYRSKQDGEKMDAAPELKSMNSKENSLVHDIGKSTDTNNSSNSNLVSIPNKLIVTDPMSETISITVGPEQKTFIIVSSTWENTIKSDHDQIQVSLNK